MGLLRIHLDFFSVLAQEFMTTLETLNLEDEVKIEHKFDKALGTIQFFLDLTCKEIARGNLTAKDVWEILKDQLEGPKSYAKSFFLTLLYTTKLKVDVDGYFKSIEVLWRRLKDLNLKLTDALVVFIALTGLPSFLRPNKYWKLERTFPWRLSRKTCNKTQS